MKNCYQKPTFFSFFMVISVTVFTILFLDGIFINQTQADTKSQSFQDHPLDTRAQTNADLKGREKEENNTTNNHVSETIRTLYSDIYASPHDGILGKKSAKISVVHFFDYNCSFCKQALNDINLFLSENDDIRFILKELPILGKKSKKIHLISVATQNIMPEKYNEFHALLMKSDFPLSEKQAFDKGVSIGIDAFKLHKEIKQDSTKKILEKNMQIAKELGILGTPSYLIGNEIIHGTLDKDSLQRKIKKLRQECTDSLC